MLKTIKITDKIKNIKLPKSQYNDTKNGKRSQSYDHVKRSGFSMHRKELVIERKKTVFTVESKNRLNSIRLTLLKKKINQSSSVNPAESSRGLSQNVTRHKDSIQESRIPQPKIFLPKIRDKNPSSQ